MSTLTKAKTTFNLNPNQPLLGPFRVFPGRLSVSRAFGDVEAKLPRFGGNPNVVVAIPEITSFTINEETDFLVLGCDGIYDQLSNKEIIDCVFMTQHENLKKINFSQHVGIAVDFILKCSMFRKTLDNVTCVILAFESYEKKFYDGDLSKTSTKIDSGVSKVSTTPAGSQDVSREISPTKLANDNLKSTDLNELRKSGVNSFRYTMTKKTQLRLFKKPIALHNGDQDTPKNLIKSERSIIPLSPFSLHAPMVTESNAKKLSVKIQSVSINSNDLKKDNTRLESSRSHFSSSVTNKSSLQKFLGLKKITPSKNYNSFKESSIRSPQGMG